MKLINIINILESQGHKITYRRRREGGVEITEINGVKFSRKKGNYYARTLTGQQLSAKQLAHVKRATKLHTRRMREIREAKRLNKPIPPKAERSKPQKIKVSKTLRIKLRKAQGEWRKLPVNPNRQQGKPTINRVRKIIETRGKREAERSIREAERYAKGVIYSGQVDFLIRRIEDIAYLNGDDASHIINIIKRHKNDFKEDQFILFKEELYKYENGVISISTLADHLTTIMKLKGQSLGIASEINKAYNEYKK